MPDPTSTSSGGVLRCCLCPNFPDLVRSALNFYGHARTKNGKGVTIPSQIRFVHYYGQYLQEGKLYRATTKIFKEIRMVGIPKFNNGTCVPYFTIRQGPGQVGLQTPPHTPAARPMDVP